MDISMPEAKEEEPKVNEILAMLDGWFLEIKNNLKARSNISEHAEIENSISRIKELIVECLHYSVRAPTSAEVNSSDHEAEIDTRKWDFEDFMRGLSKSRGELMEKLEEVFEKGGEDQGAKNKSEASIEVRTDDQKN